MLQPLYPMIDVEPAVPPIRAAAARLEFWQRGDKAQKNGPFKQAENVPRA
jgi:hypothetical protein